MNQNYEMLKIQKRMSKLGKLNKKQIPKLLKNIVLPEYHLYTDKNLLEKMMTDEANGKQLAEHEEILKNQLKESGFPSFNKNDFLAIVRSFDKFASDDYENIAQYVKKEIGITKRYITKLFKNLDNIQEGEKIRNNCIKYKKNKEQRKQAYSILNQKCQSIDKFNELRFEKMFYNKIKSKFYTLQQDKFLVFMAQVHGPQNYAMIKHELLQNRLFKFDFFLRGIKENQIGKRIQSLIRMIGNEIDYFKSEKYHKMIEDKKRKKKEAVLRMKKIQENKEKERKRVELYREREKKRIEVKKEKERKKAELNKERERKKAELNKEKERKKAVIKEKERKKAEQKNNKKIIEGEKQDKNPKPKKENKTKNNKIKQENPKNLEKPKIAKTENNPSKIAPTNPPIKHQKDNNLNQISLFESFELSKSKQQTKKE